MRKIYLLLCALLAFTATQSFSQVEVTATAGTVGPTSYTSVNSAFTAINAGIHMGSIVITINGNTIEPAPVPLLKSGGSSSYTSILIKPSGNVTVASPATAISSRGVIELHGADDVTIDGDDPATPGNRNLTIQVNTSASTTAAIVLGSKSTTGTDGATNITIKNTIIIGGRSSATSTALSYGIVFSSNPTSLTISTGSYSNTNVLIENNEVRRAYSAIYAAGASATYPNLGLTIRKNIIGSATSADNAGRNGIYVSYSTNANGDSPALIEGNDIRGGDYGTAGFGASISGVELAAGTKNSVVRNNNIHDVSQPSVSGYGAYGITVSSATTSSGITIANNFIRDMTAAKYSTSLTSPYLGWGIYVSVAVEDLKILHNTIVQSKEAATGSTVNTASACINITSSSAKVSQLYNNILVNTVPNSTNSYAIITSATINITNANGNNYYSVANIGYWASTPRATLLAWQTATGKDANSYNELPNFISATDLHINNNTKTVLESGGISESITNILTDIDGDARPGPAGSINGGGTSPDVGADEFDGKPLSCYTPNNFAIPATTVNSAHLTWDLPAGGNTTGFEIYYTLSTTPPDATTTPQITKGVVGSADITGLQSSSVYYVYIRTVCSGSETTNWIKSSFETKCDVASVPYTLNFENATVPNFPICVANEKFGAGNAWVTALAPGSGFTTTAAVYPYNASAAANAWIYSQAINVTAGVSYRLKFAYGSNSTSTYYEKLEVKYGSSASAAGMTDLLFNKTDILGPRKDTVIDFVSTITGPIFLGFHAYSDADQNRLFIDDISLTLTPTCDVPTAIQFSNISVGSVDVSWTDPALGTPQSYDIYYNATGTSPTAATAPTVSGLTASPATVSGLSSNTKYFVWMRTFCGAGGYSNWTAKDSFTTTCAAGNIPYVQDFETAVTPGLPDCTSREKVGTGNSWTTAAVSSYGFSSKVLQYGFSSNAANAWFYTQGLNLIGGTSYRLKFDYGNNSTTYTEKLKVSYGSSADHISMVNDIVDLPSIKTAMKRDTTVDFVASTTGVYYFGFNVYSAADQYNLYVDNISVTLTPTCDVPTGIVVGPVTSSTADISWNAPAVGSPVSYDIYYNTTGVAPTASTTPSKTNVVASPDQITGLTANTKYYIWMRTFCGGADYSAWTVKDSFTTKCNAATIPFTEGFEGSTNVPTCWSQQFVSGSIAFKFGNSTNAAGTTVNPDAYAGNHRLFFNSYSNSGSKTRLVSPPINLTGVNTGIDVSFYWYFSTQGGATSYLTEGVQVQYSTDGVNWTDEGTLIRRYGATAGWSKQNLTIAAAAGQPAFYVGFLFTSNAGYPSYMDSIHIYASPSCLPPTNIMATASTTSTADIQWTPPATGTPVSYDVYYSKTNTPPTAATNPQQTGVSATSTTLIGLDASSLYYVWVRTFCGGTDRSEWSSALKFNTACDVLNTPWSEGFENVPADGDGALPLCWSKENIAGSATGFGVSNTSDAYRGPRTGAYALYTRYSSTNWIYTPGFNLSQDSIYEFSFYMMNKYGTAGFTMDVAYGTDTTAAAMTNSLLAGYAANNTGYIKFNYVIQPTATGVYHFGIKSTSPNTTPWYLNFDDFSLITTGSLPVTISSFKAENAGSVNNILWTTATEQNNAGFEVERSADGNKFEKMAFVASKAEGGNSASTLHYSLTDNKPFVLGTYYRLKQLDKDGKSTYSNVVFVKSGSPVRMEIVNLYPNPAKSQITLLMTAPATNKVQVVVSDLSGRVVMSESRSIEAGENKIMLNVNNLPSGTYMLKAVCADGCESAVKKFVKE